MSTTIPLSGPINLLARIGHGSITVTARDDLAEATVRLTSRVATSDILERIVVEMRGPTLAVVAPRQGGIADLIGGWRRERDSIDAVIDVPAGTALKIATATADIAVKGRCGGADIATGSALINIDTVDGDLRLRYGNGTTHVQAVLGNATVRSGAGDARFGEVGGALQAGFGRGNLDVAVAHGDVRSRTGAGTANIDAAYADVDLASGSGRVSVGLPPRTAARLDVTTGSGEVSSDLPIDEAAGAGERSITIRVRTGSGNVRLFRSA